MTSLLDDELVKRYFKCEHGETPERGSASAWHVRVCMADKVLQSMQQPIKNGDKFLQWWGDNWIENQSVSDGGLFEEPWHPNYLRLPNEFQEKEECKTHGFSCHTCGRRLVHERKPETAGCDFNPPFINSCSWDGLTHYDYCPKFKPTPETAGCQHENHSRNLPCPDCQGKLNKQPTPAPEKECSCGGKHLFGNCKPDAVEKECVCCRHEQCAYHAEHDPRPDAVEKKIKDIWVNYSDVSHGDDGLEKQLRELVKLVREGK